MNHPSSVPQIAQPGTHAVEYSLHGLLGIRLVNASASDIAAVTDQLGPIQARLETEPDITVRFVDRLHRPAGTCHIGLNDAAFTRDRFFLDGRGPRAQLDLSRLGGEVEIVCESRTGRVPLLIPMINLMLLAKGVAAIHASAFVYRGIGVVVAGWAKGGKTEALLAFMARGAQYVGDEWIYISPAENRVFGIPEPIRIWDWHVNHGGDRRRVFDRRTRALFRTIKIGSGLARAVSATLGRTPGAAAASRAASLLEGRLWARIAPADLFGRASCTSEAPLDRLFLAITHDSEATEVVNATSGDVVPRIAFSTQYERLGFLSNYLKFRFALPDAASDLVDNAAEIEHELIAKALSRVPTSIVRHPFPADIPALFEVMEPVVLGR
jgi:hypothetical protein